MWEHSPCQPHPTTSVRGYSHHGAGVASLLAALADQESAVPLAAQHLFCLQAVDLPHVPRSFLMVGQLLLIIHHGVLAAIEHRQGQTPSVWACGPHISPHTASCHHPFRQGRCPQLPGREMGLAHNPEAGRTGCAAYAPAAPPHPTTPKQGHSLLCLVLDAQPLVDFLLPGTFLRQPPGEGEAELSTGSVPGLRHPDQTLLAQPSPEGSSRPLCGRAVPQGCTLQGSILHPAAHKPVRQAPKPSRS